MTYVESPGPGPDPCAQSVLDDVAESICEELSNGDADIALQIALDAIRRLRSTRPTGVTRPRSTGDPRWDALLAAGARIALRGREVGPGWGVRLSEPWFPGEDVGGRMSHAYRQLTIRRTPKEFADLNIFLNDKSLQTEAQ